MAGNRQYTSRERRLLSEFLALHRAKNRKILNFRLGAQAFRTGAPMPAGVPEAAYQNTRMYSDAAVENNGIVELWEAKAVLTGAGIGQLMEYAIAWPESPDDHEFAGMATTLKIVTAVARPTALRLAASVGIEVHIYTPAWIVAEFEQWYTHLARPIAGASASVAG